jgi:hypothetical protein
LTLLLTQTPRSLWIIAIAGEHHQIDEPASGDKASGDKDGVG